MDKNIKNNKIATVVVTYNRKELLKECLDALLNQTYPLDSIILIDNASTDGTPEFLKEQGYLNNPKIDYVRLPENTGGAGGFHEGVKRGYEKGYDWLWLMDDDAEPKEDALEKLSKYFNENNLSALAGSVLLTNGIISYIARGNINLNCMLPIPQKPLESKFYRSNFIEIDMASFVGILVSKKAIEKVGYPKKEFFIQGDDAEYCIRLRQVGKIFLIPDSVIIHKEATKKGKIIKRFMGREFLRVPYDKFWLNYYSMRNLVWLGKQYSTNKINFYLGLGKNFIKSIIGVLVYDDKKLKRIHFIVNSYIDGLKGIFDNEKPKRILYR